MAQIPLGIGAYNRPYGKLPEIRLENRFFEQNPLTAEQVALLSRPGTSQFLEVGDGPIRTLYSQYGVFEGDLFIVSGEELFRYSGGLVTPIDGVVAGSGYPVITSVAIPGWEAIFISDGLSLQYYDGPAGIVHELKPCSVPDDVPITDLATINSYVLAVQGLSRKFFWINPGETDIGPLNFSSMEAEPDQIVNVVVVGDQIWFFGQSSSEAWYASGDAEQPFIRAQGRAFSQGILPGTLAKIQDQIVLVAQDRVAYLIAGSPQRISHHGIEEMLRQWAETSEIDVSIDYTIINERVVQFAGGAATSSPITEWAWDFGDGSPVDILSGANPQHTYAALGSYTVTLTVTAEDGRTGTVQRTIDVTTLLIAPTALAGVWSRTSATDEQIALSWTDPNAYVAALPRRVYWNGFLIADLAAGVVAYVHDTDHGTDPLVGEAENDYIVLYYEGTDEGLEAEVSVWSGPPALTGVEWTPRFSSVSGGELAYLFGISFTHEYANASVDLEDDYLCPGVFVLNDTLDNSEADTDIRVGLSGLVMVSSPGANLQQFQARLRAYRDTFGVTDFSPYATLDVAVLGDSTGDPDGFQTCP